MREEIGNVAEERFSKWTKATDSRILKNPKYDKYKEKSY